MFMRRLGAGCYLPVAAYGHIAGGMLSLQGLVISADGQRQVRVQISAPWTRCCKEAEQLGMRLAEEALAQGADKIIQEVSAVRTREFDHV
jgi:hydroxymethylbilane synthase